MTSHCAATEHEKRESEIGIGKRAKVGFLDDFHFLEWKVERDETFCHQR